MKGDNPQTFESKITMNNKTPRKIGPFPCIIDESGNPRPDVWYDDQNAWHPLVESDSLPMLRYGIWRYANSIDWEYTDCGWYYTSPYGSDVRDPYLTSVVPPHSPLFRHLSEGEQEYILLWEKIDLRAQSSLVADHVYHVKYGSSRYNHSAIHYTNNTFCSLCDNDTDLRTALGVK